MMQYLALGDSYTIGEQVPIFESFPYQLLQGLRMKGLAISAPEIVAKTGWTTDELQSALTDWKAQPPYDLVTLLIGVNNQYRERPVETYTPEFADLLEQALTFAGGRTERVGVLSIPDWSVTPFAEDRDRRSIATAIDAYNAANKALTVARGVAYFDITPFTREAAQDRTLLAGDGLHPGGKDYARWASLLIDHFYPLLSA